MSVADSVSIFAEGTFEEQIRELVSYLARGKSEEEQAQFNEPFSAALTIPEGGKPLEEDADKRKEIIGNVLAQTASLGTGSEKEIEGFFNLLFSHFLSLYPHDAPETKELISPLLRVIASSPGEALVKYRLLSNLFNALPRSSALRLSTYAALLDLASGNDDLDTLHIDKNEVGRWLSEWSISPEEKSTFLKQISDAYAKAERSLLAYEYSLAHVHSLAPFSPEAQEAAVGAITTALTLPGVFDFDPLFKLDAVVAANENPMFALLQVFLNGGLEEYNAWEDANAGSVLAQIPDLSQLGRKIRLLTLSSLAFENVGRDLPYASIASALQIMPAQVERWVIDTIRAGLISGKLSQTTQTLHVARATPRKFERAQWETLEQRLLAWKAGLEQVIDIVATSQKSVGGKQQPAAASAEVKDTTAQTTAVGA